MVVNSNMKTVGTKLDNSEYEIFEFCCSENGLTKSEQLRDLIKTFVNTNDEEVIHLDLDKEQTVAKPLPEGIITRVSYDDGKTWHDVKPIPELMNVTVES